MIRLFILCILSVSLTAAHIADDPEVKAAMASLEEAQRNVEAAKHRVADTIAARLNSMDWSPLPAVELGKDPRQSEIDRASAVKTYNQAVNRIQNRIGRYADPAARVTGDTWFNEMIAQTQAWLDLRAAAGLSVAPVESAASGTKSERRTRARAVLADGTVIEQ